MTEQRPDPWLITKLFDLRFSRFVALSLVRIVYVVLMIAGLVAFFLAHHGRMRRKRQIEQLSDQAGVF